MLSAEQAMVLVRERGRAMAEASAATPTSMTAVIGGDPEEVLGRLAAHGLTAANNNGSGQIVAAGTKDQLATGSRSSSPRQAHRAQRRGSIPYRAHGARCRPARGAGAGNLYDPRTRLLSNTDGQVVHDGREVLRRLVGQGYAGPLGPLHDSHERSRRHRPAGGPPAGTLTGIAKRNLKGVELFALNTPDQLEEAIEFVQKHGGAAAASPIAGNPTWRLIVSPGRASLYAPRTSRLTRSCQPTAPSGWSRTSVTKCR